MSNEIRYLPEQLTELVLVHRLFAKVDTVCYITSSDSMHTSKLQQLYVCSIYLLQAGIPSDHQPQHTDTYTQTHLASCFLRNTTYYVLQTQGIKCVQSNLILTNSLIVNQVLLKQTVIIIIVLFWLLTSSNRPLSKSLPSGYHKKQL